MGAGFLLLNWGCPDPSSELKAVWLLATCAVLRALCTVRTGLITRGNITARVSVQRYGSSHSRGLEQSGFYLQNEINQP